MSFVTPRSLGPLNNEVRAYYNSANPRAVILMLAPDLIQKMGLDYHVRVHVGTGQNISQVRMLHRESNRDGCRKAITYQGRGKSGRVVFSAGQIGRRAPAKTIVVPHRFDGDDLIVDLSALPKDREEVSRAA